MNDASEKICVLCGESCAGQPRTKDRKGRYYHQRCHDEAVAVKRKREQSKQRAEEQSAEQAFVSAEPPPVLSDEDNPLSILLKDVARTNSPGGAATTCPSCGAGVAADAVLCVNCGFNLQSGQAVQTDVTAAVVDQVATQDDSRTRWPNVLGILTILYAGLSAGFSALNAAQAAIETNVAMMIMPVFFILLHVWALAAGIGVIRRRASGVLHLRIWAIVKTILMATCFAVVFTLFLTARSEFDENMPPELAPIAGFLLAFLILAIVWELSWPVFCFVWTGRSKIRSEVANWT